MKKKFDRYTIEVSNKKITRQPNGSLILEANLKGNIEIGIEIDNWTWRGDWFLSLFKNTVSDIERRYRIQRVDNDDNWDSENRIETNHVSMFVTER